LDQQSSDELATPACLDIKKTLQIDASVDVCYGMGMSFGCACGMHTTGTLFS